jgi:pimeloyl-ACP methyl ester carboxylesterase
MSLRLPSFIESSDGVRIRVHDFGAPDAPDRPVLLFSHATGFHGRVWEPMASSLVDRYHCVALDYRGHGLSELPQGVSLQWSGMADDAAAVLSELSPGAPVHGIGHSMGGAALVLAAARHHDVVRSLWLYEPVILPPGQGPSFDGSNPMAEAASRRRERFDSFEQAVSNFASKEPLNHLDPIALRAYVDGGFSREPDGSVVLRCRPSTEAEVFRQAAGNGAWDVLAELELPVAVVAGRPEELGPVAFAPIVAAALPYGHFFEKARLGHFGPLEDPAGMASDVDDWVRAHP